ncbi:MAG: TRAP transporter fused permease subunit [Chloroflexi bacterium]|nr:TRAP transporter fused permease subunit [Chloroflexota bacterium]
MPDEPIIVSDTEPIVSPEQAEELIEKFEGATRTIPGRVGKFVSIIAVAMSVFALYGALATIDPQVQRGIHLLFALVLIFFLYPARANGSWRTRVEWADLILVGLSIAAIGYIFTDFEKFIYRAAIPFDRDIIFGGLLILLILEAVRRAIGWHLAALIAIFVVYGLIGPKGLIPLDLPSPFGHRGYDLGRIVGHIYMTLEGIFGVPIEVSSTFIIMFIIYGALLDFSGAGQFFVDLSFALFGKKPTGAGRTVTFASFLLGGPSGSGVATTVTLGSIAYPMLKKAGYDKENAGGLLSAGGIGAVLSPPVLGPAAFIMAEYLRISYLQVVIMSIMPTVLYYFSIFLMVELDAHRFGIKEVKIETKPLKDILRKYGYHLTSLFTIVVLMFFFTPILAVFFASIVAFLFSFLRPETALVPSKLWKALETAAKQVLSVAVTCAGAGIVIGIFSLTGLGLKISGIITDLSGANVFLALLYTAIAIWLLGLALPISASYIIARVLTWPALVKLGVNQFAADMFIFYYAILSEVSPPVGLAPFAAAALTGGNPYKTMMMAWKYTLPAFVVPFMFALAPAGVGLLLQGNVDNIIFTTVTALIGITALTAGVGGWLLNKSKWWERFILIAAGLLLIYPEQSLDVIGLALFGVVFFSQWVQRQRLVSVA